MLTAILEGFFFQVPGDKALYTTLYFRRELLIHILDNLDLWKDKLLLEIAGNYGSEEDRLDDTFMTVRKWFLYMCCDKVWCDALMLASAASRLGMKTSVLRADTLAEQRFRHTYSLENKAEQDQIEIILLFNGNMQTGHYSVILRKDGYWNNCKEVVGSIGFDQDVDEVERYERGERNMEWKKAWEFSKRMGGAGKRQDKGKSNEKPESPKVPEGMVLVAKERLVELVKNEEILYRMISLSDAAKGGLTMEEVDKICKGVPKRQSPRKTPVKRNLFDIYSSQDEMSMDEEATRKKVRKGDVYCPDCNQEFTSTFALKGHINRMHKNKYNYACSVCGKGLSTAESYRDHAVTHLDDNHKYKCDHCLDLAPPVLHLFSATKSLNAHIKQVHTNPKAIKCSHCDKVCNNQSNIKQHELGCNSNPNRVVIHCGIEQCAFSSYWPRKVKFHKVKVHGWVKPLVRHPEGPKSQKTPEKRPPPSQDK